MGFIFVSVPSKSIAKTVVSQVKLGDNGFLVEWVKVKKPLKG